jgi:diguanylate cyclase (GGDEF)-like protein
MAIILVDIDRLAAINAQRGYEAGTAAIVAMTTALRKNLRSDDEVHRIDGGGFVAILDNSNYRGAHKAVSRVQAAMERLAAFPLRVKIGMAAFPDDGEDLDSLLHTADSRLYNSRPGQGAAAVPPASPPKAPRKRPRPEPDPGQGALDLDPN